MITRNFAIINFDDGNFSVIFGAQSRIAIDVDDFDVDRNPQRDARNNIKNFVAKRTAFSTINANVGAHRRENN